MKHCRLSALAISSVLLLSGCGNDPENTDVPLSAAEPVKVSINEPATGMALPEDLIGSDASLSAVIGASEIPYPVYPNGAKYRVGGENGLKIVLFETEDSFEEVDGFYKGVTHESGMPRLIATNDYVRYSSSDDDKDPWATYRPGIVIHKFNDDSERNAVGADKTARTNIIMSF